MAGIPSTEIRQEAEKKSRELSRVSEQILGIYRQHPKGDDGARTFTEAMRRQLLAAEGDAAKLTREIGALHEDYREAVAEEQLARLADDALGTPRRLFPGAPAGEGAAMGPPAGAVKIAGQVDLTRALMETRSYKSWQKGFQNQHAALELEGVEWRDVARKATLDSTGFTGYERPPGAILLGQQMLTVEDLCAAATTDQPTVRYLQETTFTNAATSVAEGAAKPEATWDLDEVDAAVRKVAVITKVTDEAFADYGQLRSYIDQRLPFSVQQRAEFLILNGDGTPPNHRGIMQTSGILTQARGTDTNIDAIYKAITKVRTEGFYEPDGVVIDPTNWTPIRLAKDTTGSYIYGDPWVPGPETIFGKRVIATVNQVDNTALVGQFRLGCTIYNRQGLRIESTNSNEDDFEKNLVTLRAERRFAVVVHRPTAFCTVTSLTT